MNQLTLLFLLSCTDVMATSGCYFSEDIQGDYITKSRYLQSPESFTDSSGRDENQHMHITQVSILSNIVSIWGSCYKKLPHNNVIFVDSYDNDLSFCIRCVQLKKLSPSGNVVIGVWTVETAVPSFQPVLKDVDPRNRSIVTAGPCYATVTEAQMACPLSTARQHFNFTRLVTSSSFNHLLLYKTPDFFRKENCPIVGKYKIQEYNSQSKWATQCSINQQYSALDNCPSENQLNIRLRNCSGQPNKDFIYECLASWNGPTNLTYLALYRIGTVSDGINDITDFSPNYRCSIYKHESEENGNKMTIKISDDDSCPLDLENNNQNLMRSTITITAASYADTTDSIVETILLNSTRCRFPDWLQGSWTDVQVDDHLLVFMDRQHFTTFHFHCLSQFKQSPMSESFQEDNSEVKMISYVYTRCGEKTLRCLKITRRTYSIFEMQVGEIGANLNMLNNLHTSKSFNDLNFNTESFCSDKFFVSNFWITQARNGRWEGGVSCPIIGHYEGHIPNEEGICATLSSDCHSPHIMYHDVHECQISSSYTTGFQHNFLTNGKLNKIGRRYRRNVSDGLSVSIINENDETATNKMSSKTQNDSIEGNDSNGRLEKMPSVLVDDEFKHNKPFEATVALITGISSTKSAELRKTEMDHPYGIPEMTNVVNSTVAASFSAVSESIDTDVANTDSTIRYKQPGPPHFEFSTHYLNPQLNSFYQQQHINSDRHQLSSFPSTVFPDYISSQTPLIREEQYFNLTSTYQPYTYSYISPVSQLSSTSYSPYLTKNYYSQPSNSNNANNYSSRATVKNTWMATSSTQKHDWKVVASSAKEVRVKDHSDNNPYVNKLNRTIIALPPIQIPHVIDPPAPNHFQHNMWFQSQWKSNTAAFNRRQIHAHILRSSNLKERVYSCLGEWRENGLTYTLTRWRIRQRTSSDNTYLDSNSDPRDDYDGSYECFVGAAVSQNEILIKEAGSNCRRDVDLFAYGMKITRIGTCEGQKQWQKDEKSLPTDSRDVVPNSINVETNTVTTTNDVTVITTLANFEPAITVPELFKSSKQPQQQRQNLQNLPHQSTSSWRPIISVVTAPGGRETEQNRRKQKNVKKSEIKRNCASTTFIITSSTYRLFRFLTVILLSLICI